MQLLYLQEYITPSCFIHIAIGSYSWC